MGEQSLDHLVSSSQRYIAYEEVDSLILERLKPAKCSLALFGQIYSL